MAYAIDHKKCLKSSHCATVISAPGCYFCDFVKINTGHLFWFQDNGSLKKKNCLNLNKQTSCRKRCKWSFWYCKQRQRWFKRTVKYFTTCFVQILTIILKVLLKFIKSRLFFFIIGIKDRSEIWCFRHYWKRICYSFYYNTEICYW